MGEASVLAVLTALVGAYVCGSIPTGVLVSRRLGIAVREHGSGNIGATNVARTAGRTAGILTLLGDVLKGYIPVAVARSVEFGEIVIASTAVAALLGHVFPVFLSFSGGKGVATGFGVVLGLAPLVSLLIILFFLPTFLMTRIVASASLVAASATPLLLFVLGYPASDIAAGIAIAALIIAKHRENIGRLWKGQEPRFRLGKPGGRSA